MLRDRLSKIRALAIDTVQKAGVSGVLLAPLSYQPLNGDEVYELYHRVTRELSIPLCVYDNPATTGFSFTLELLISIASMPKVGSINLGNLPGEYDGATRQIATIRSKIPASVTIGISGDAHSARGLLCGCEVWYSVWAGLFPQYSRLITCAAQAGDEVRVKQLDSALEALWGFYRRYGSLRVIATVAELQGRVQTPCLPFPLRTIQGEERVLLEQKLLELNFLA
ncbi:dihydrodipicolinate synthase family protein [Buttiauxella gaviniae]|uniref:dihydrodipicolinate synthase family protein n=1 Tax=Buttiauxella gaviniae TaxID=82990 RepID=UPI0009439CE7|nr:dihydrodipicolinate synthase family protein [Buttiauxella gaviniae]